MDPTGLKSEREAARGGGPNKSNMRLSGRFHYHLPNLLCFPGFNGLPEMLVQGQNLDSKYLNTQHTAVHIAVSQS